MPHVFSGNEVPAGALNEDRVVPKPTPRDIADPNWPRLTDVPPRPQNFTSEEDINHGIGGMRNDRSQGQIMKQNVEEFSDTDPQPHE